MSLVLIFSTLYAEIVGGDPVGHKDVRAVKDNAIVLRADRVETVEAEPTAVEPGEDKDMPNQL